MRILAGNYIKWLVSVRGPTANVIMRHTACLQFTGSGNGINQIHTQNQRTIYTHEECSNVTLGLNNNENGKHRSRPGSKVNRNWIFCIAGFGLATGTGFLAFDKAKADCDSAKNLPKGDHTTVGSFKEGLPIYTLEEVEKHKTKETGIWVTFKCGVYDISKFAQYHPGGPKIFLASGGSLEPFWELYAVHKEENVLEMLEHMRIGNIDPADMKRAAVKKSIINDPFANDPKRHPALKINSPKPFNAEPPPELLIDNFITPNELFFVRNHLPVPHVDVKKYKLEISGGGIRKPVSLSIRDLKNKFEVHTISAVIQCAGNRRQEMSSIKEVKGLSWGTTAIGNAEWTGIKLCDVLNYAGIKEGDIAHVQFEGLDKDVTGTSYGASIPAETAMDPKREVLLAFSMNGKDLPVDHGYPLRVVVPGSAGARHVKWLSKIIASREESNSHWQKNDYKTFNPSINWNTVDFSKAQAIQEYPIQSAICDPAPNAMLSDSTAVTVRGYAWSGGGRGIARVDVSIDGGKTWHSADLHQEPQKYHRQWAWTLWEGHLDIPQNHSGNLEIVCKATDTANNAQPSNGEGIWNLRGLLNNAWHKIHVRLPADDDD